MKNFELFMGCLGNGVTVCNKAVEEHGDYKQVAHISNGGNIKFYVPASSIPGPDLLHIEHTANAMYENVKQAIERDLAADRARMYFRMLDALPYSVYKRFTDETQDESEETKIEKLKTMYLEYV